MELEVYSDLVCVICNTVRDEKLVSVRSVGKETLKKCSVIHGRDGLSRYLSTDSPVIKVHKSCQLQLTNMRHIEQLKRKPSISTTVESDIIPKILRSLSTELFQ